MGCLAKVRTGPCSPCAPRPRLPFRTVPPDTLADCCVPAAFLAQQSFDVGMSEQSSQRPSPLDEGTSFSLPRFKPTEKEKEVEILVYRVVSEEVRDLYGDILIKMASLGYPCQHHPNTALPAPSCMRCRTAVPAALLSARRPTLMCPLSHALRFSVLRWASDLGLPNVATRGQRAARAARARSSSASAGATARLPTSSPSGRARAPRAARCWAR